jgi:hypothetical protein
MAALLLETWMHRISGRWLALPAAGVVIAAILLTDPAGDSFAGLDLSADQANITERRIALEEESDVVMNRVEYKEHLIRQLIEGELTLEQVMVEFLRVNEIAPELTGIIRDRYQGSGDEEKTAQSVLEFVRLRVPGGQGRDRLWVRLDREFQELFGHSPRLD